MSIRVILADDHAVVRSGIRQFLETADDLIVIAEAQDGEVAKIVIADHKPDVAILDLRMPKFNGIEVTRWVKKTFPAVKVLILTAFDDQPYIKAALDAGANGYMLKTTHPESIVKAVRAVSKGTQYYDERIIEKVAKIPVNSKLPPQQYEELTQREHEILVLASKGLTNKEIGYKLSISSRTAQTHLASIYRKLDVNSRTKAVVKAVKIGLIDPID